MSRVEPNRNVYVGHRYVPKIFGEWDKKNEYEGLSIVTHQGNSYTSKKRVPVGIDILNEEFWAVTGNYNAQVDYYRQETERVAKDLLLKSDITYVDTELGKKSDKTYVDTELGKKANQTYVDTELGKKADTSFVNTELGKKSDKTYVDTELGKKSDTTYVDNELSKKSDKTYVDTELSKKTDNESLNYRGVNIYDLGIEDNDNIDQTDQLKSILLNSNYNNIIIPFNIKISSDIVIKSKNNMTITFENQSSIITDSCNGLKFVSCQDLKLDNYSTQPLSREWGSNYSGLIIEDSSNGKHKINNIRNYKKGLSLLGKNGGVAYTTFEINKSHNNETDIYIESEGDGWVTEIEFYGGRFYVDSDLRAVTSNSWVVKTFNNGRYVTNNIRFYSPAFESKHNGILGNGAEWLLVHPRFENVEDNHLSGTLYRSVFIYSFGMFDRRRTNLSNQSRNNSIIGKGNDYESTFSTMGGQYSGYSFINAGDLENLGELTYIKNRKTVGFKNTRNINQPFNKQFESTNIPDKGTFHNGAIVWKYPPTPGEPMGWMCRYPGTFGSLQNVTATTTANSREIKLNNSKELKVDDMIRINDNVYTIDYVNNNNNNITVSPAPTEPLNGVNVEYVTPVFIPMPNMPS